MSIKKRASVPVGGIPGLDPAVEDLLLVGSPESDPFFEFLFSIDQIRALAQEHEAALWAEARRRGLAAPWCLTCYGQRPRRHKTRR